MYNATLQALHMGHGLSLPVCCGKRQHWQSVHSKLAEVAYITLIPSYLHE